MDDQVDDQVTGDGRLPGAPNCGQAGCVEDERHYDYDHVVPRETRIRVNAEDTATGEYVFVNVSPESAHNLVEALHFNGAHRYAPDGMPLVGPSDPGSVSPASFAIDGLPDEWDRMSHYAKGAASNALRRCAADLREALRSDTR